MSTAKGDVTVTFVDNTPASVLKAFPIARHTRTSLSTWQPPLDTTAPKSELPTGMVPTRDWGAGAPHMSSLLGPPPLPPCPRWCSPKGL